MLPIDNLDVEEENGYEKILFIFELGKSILFFCIGFVLFRRSFRMPSNPSFIFSTAELKFGKALLGFVGFALMLWAVISPILRSGFIEISHEITERWELQEDGTMLLIKGGGETIKTIFDDYNEEAEQ